MDGAPALTGTSVLELSTGLPGAYCGRLLAMVGAAVVKVESATRRDDARAAGTGVDRFLHAQKRSVALDVGTHAGGELLVRLAAGADVLIDDGSLGAPPGVRDRYDELLAANPRLVLVAISPYGLDGPRTAWQATELTELAAGGWLPFGPRGATPVMPGAASARYSAGTLAALGALLALRARRRTGRGQLVEVPMNEALVHMLTAPTTVFSFSGVDLPRMGDGFPYGIYRCADGHLGINVLTQSHWTGLCRLMGREDLIDDPRYRTGAERADPAVAEELDAIITEWAARQPAHATFHAAQATRTPVTIVPSPVEVLESPQYAARDYWVEDEAPGLGRLRLPGAPFKLASGALAPFRSAHDVGADTADVLGSEAPDRRGDRVSS